MELGSIGAREAALPPVASLQESEAAERVPDKEAAEAQRAKSPLPLDAGSLIDTQA
jgi:hypothetical protein